MTKITDLTIGPDQAVTVSRAELDAGVSKFHNRDDEDDGAPLSPALLTIQQKVAKKFGKTPPYKVINFGLVLQTHCYQREDTQRGTTERGSGRPSRVRPGDGEGGRKLQVARTDNTGGVSILRHDIWDNGKKGHGPKPSTHSKERGGGVSNGRATADWGKLVEERTI
jgi:hypothetical protein